MERAFGYARLLGTPGTLIANATVTVKKAGTSTLATIYADNLATPTPKANPFTTDAYGFWFFYAIDGRYDVEISGGTPAVTTYTLGDVQVHQVIDPVGAVGDGTTDDTTAIQATIDLGKSIDFGHGKTYRITSRLNFNQSNVTYYGRGGTKFKYDFPQTNSSTTGRIGQLTGSRVTFEGLTFDGNGKQVDGCLLYIDDNAVDARFLRCRFTNVTGVHVNNDTNSSANNQYGVIISPYGVRQFVFENCEFDTITNRNNNVGVAQTVGFGFCGGLLIGIRGTYAEPTDAQGVPSSGVISACDFHDIYTVLAVGLSQNDRTSYDDGDAIRFYGNTAGATVLPVVVSDCTFRGISKRAIKGSVTRYVTVRDCYVDGSQLSYPMATVIKAEWGWTVENIKMITTAAKPFDKAFQIHDVSNLTVKDIYCSHVLDFFNFAPTDTAATQENITIEGIVCPSVSSSGFSTSTQCTRLKNIRYAHMRLVAASGVNGISLFHNFSSSSGFNGANVEDIEVVNGEFKVEGYHNTVRDVRVLLDNASYTGSASARALVEVANTPGFPTPAAPTAADGGGAGAVTGQRWYKIADIHSDGRRSDLSAAVAHTPGGANGAVVVTRPTINGTSWELYGAAAERGPYKLLATTLAATTTYSDTTSGSPPVFSGAAPPELPWNRVRDLRVDVIAAPTTYLNATRTNLVWLSGDRMEIDGVRVWVTPDLAVTQPHVTIYGHYITASDIDYWGEGFIAWMHSTSFVMFEGSVLRGVSRLGGRVGATTFIKSQYAKRTLIQNILDDCSGSQVVLDVTGAAGGQEYHLQDIVSRSTANPLFTGGGITALSGGYGGYLSNALALVDGVTPPPQPVVSHSSM